GARRLGAGRNAVASLPAGHLPAVDPRRVGRCAAGVRAGARLLHHAGDGRRPTRHHVVDADRQPSRPAQLGLRRQPVRGTAGDRTRHYRRVLSPAWHRQCLPDECAMINRVLRVAVVALLLFFLAFPIVVVFVVSFSQASYLTFPPPTFGLRWYHAYFSNAD